MRLKNISFRLGMFAGFALILILLGSSAWSSWVMLERLAAQSRQGSEEAIEMMAAVAATARWPWIRVASGLT